MASALTQPNDNSGLRWQLLQDRNDPGYYQAKYPDHEGVAVWIRPDPPRAIHAAEMREQGILTVSEVDDNYLANPLLNIFQRQSGYSESDQRLHLHSLTSMERIVFSTDWLRDYYWKAIRKAFGKRLIPELFVCRNNIDQADWPEPVPREGPLRVGWMGSSSHIWDVDIAWNALLHAKGMGCETVMIGHDPTLPEGRELPEGMRTAKSQAKIDAWKRVGFTHIPWIAPQDYHRAALPLDIGLAPVLHNNHCQGKSDCKFVEYSISGAATIASNTEPYKTIRHMETGILVGSQREMLGAVDLLIRDEALRERLVRNAREYVKNERGLSQLRAEWGAALTL